MSSTTADKINYLLDTKEEIRQAINEKFVDVPTSATFRSYADSIRAIPTGNKMCRFVIGTSTTGWTEKDCDYLCDGVDDQVEINAAIQALPSTGGEIKVLDGTYNITAIININKIITFRGCGYNTIFKRMFNASTNSEGIIKISRAYVTLSDFTLDGNKTVYASGSGLGQTNSNLNHVTIKNIIAKNNYYSGMNIGVLWYSIIEGNYCLYNDTYGINATSNNSSIITNNICEDSGIYGIYIGGKENIVSSNYIKNNTTDGGGIKYIGDNESSGHIVIGNKIYIKSKNGISFGNANINGVDYGIWNTIVIGNVIHKTSYTSSEHSIYTTSSSKNCIFMGNISIGKAPTISGTGHITINNKY